MKNTDKFITILIITLTIILMNDRLTYVEEANKKELILNIEEVVGIVGEEIKIIEEYENGLFLFQIMEQRYWVHTRRDEENNYEVVQIETRGSNVYLSGR